MILFFIAISNFKFDVFIIVLFVPLINYIRMISEGVCNSKVMVAIIFVASCHIPHFKSLQ